MTRPPKALFVFKARELGSAQIRAVQIAGALGADLLALGQLDADVAGRYDVVVYVKRTPPRRVMEAVRQRGTRQIFDVVDNYRAWRITRAAPLVDCFIGANLTHTLYLQQSYGRLAVEIPHHHCNFDNLRIPVRTGPPTLGYIGDIVRWPANRRVVTRLPYPHLESFRHKGAEGFAALVSAYLATDIGYDYRRETDKMRFNSAVKLVNFMSFGIPAVLGPESAYLEVARHGEAVLYAHAKADFVMLLRHLAEDEPLRRRMGDACYELARPFHISRIAERYREFLSGW